MPGVLKPQASWPSGVMAMTPPSPLRVVSWWSIISLTAACRVRCLYWTSAQMERAMVRRMKYSPVPVAETAQESLEA